LKCEIIELPIHARQKRMAVAIHKHEAQVVTFARNQDSCIEDLATDFDGAVHTGMVLLYKPTNCFCAHQVPGYRQGSGLNETVALSDDRKIIEFTGSGRRTHDSSSFING
jgi:hypothetical protein